MKKNENTILAVPLTPPTIKILRLWRNWGGGGCFILSTYRIYFKTRVAIRIKISDPDADPAGAPSLLKIFKMPSIEFQMILQAFFFGVHAFGSRPGKTWEGFRRLGEKYDELLRKTRIRGGKKGEKRKFFLYIGEKI